MKKMLLIAPDYMNLYQDILAELEIQGWHVDYIKELSLDYDPRNIRRETTMKESEFNEQMNRYWNTVLSSPKYSVKYDYLFVINGQGLRKCVFDILLSRNPSMLSTNYLFDSIKGVYRFDLNFSYFNNIFTFDKCDSEKFLIQHMPLYWLPGTSVPEIRVFFGFGTSSPQRCRFYKEIKSYAESNQLPYSISLYANKINNFTLYRIKFLLRKLLGLPPHISPDEYKSGMISFDTLPPAIFRKMIFESSVILDTAALHQDGLTPRFMWALGAGKKIITTNQAASLYDFCPSDRVMIWRPGADVSSFLSMPMEKYESFIQRIIHLRIDNWIHELICSK